MTEGATIVASFSLAIVILVSVMSNQTRSVVWCGVVWYGALCFVDVVEGCPQRDAQNETSKEIGGGGNRMRESSMARRKG